VSIGKVSQHTLYKAINKPLWHPNEFPALAPDQQAEPHIQQEITQQTTKPSKPNEEKAPDRLKNKGITQLLFKVGFVINAFWLGALGALAPKGQSAAQKALFLPEPQERGESEGGESLITGWTELRRSLPEGLQEKIAQAERARQRQDELEQKRRERASQRRQLRVVDTSAEAHAQLELEIAQQFENYGVDEEHTAIVCDAEPRYDTLLLVVETVEADCLQVEQDPIVEVQSCPVQEAEEGRVPYAWEQQEFEQWYGLAETFGLVEDWYWDGLQYWVSRGDRVWPFAELSGVFTVGWLRSRA
jgi:hypothetical protein